MGQRSHLWRLLCPPLVTLYQVCFYATRIFASGCQPAAARRFSAYFPANCAIPRRPLTRHGRLRGEPRRHARRQAENRIAFQAAQRQQRRGKILGHLRERSFRLPQRVADDAPVIGITFEDDQRRVGEETPKRGGSPTETRRCSRRCPARPAAARRAAPPASACRLLFRRRQSLW